MVDQAIIMVKLANIKKSMDRLKGKKDITLEEFLVNMDAQDIVMMNMQVAIQGCIDLASHIVSDSDWGVPGSIAGLFDILYEHKVIAEKTMGIMRQMTGFRNLIVHEYAKLDMYRVYEIFNSRLGDINYYLKEVILYAKL